MRRSKRELLIHYCLNIFYSFYNAVLLFHFSPITRRGHLLSRANRGARETNYRVSEVLRERAIEKKKTKLVFEMVKSWVKRVEVE